MPRGWFITGTDTDAGKTVVSAILALGLDANYWKPVQTGAPTDSQCLAAWTGLGPDRIYPEAWRLPLPASPHWAAQRAGTSISLRGFRLPAVSSRAWVVEGAGGALVPLNERECMADLMLALQLPVIVVARQRLGAINHTLLTLEALRRRGLEISGVVLNHAPTGDSRASHADAGAASAEALAANPPAIENLGQTRVLAELPHLARLDRRSLEEAFAAYFRPRFSAM